MKFRKKITIFPGFKINLSRSGVSATVGPQGANINISKRGAAVNTGIPGTGLYERTTIISDNSDSGIDTEDFDTDAAERIKTQATEQDSGIQTSKDLIDIRYTLQQAFATRSQLTDEYIDAQSALTRAEKSFALSKLLLFGYIFPFKRNKVRKAKERLMQIGQEISKVCVEIDIEMDQKLQESYLKLLDAFTTLSSSAMIWDITEIAEFDKRKVRSNASLSIKRIETKLDNRGFQVIKSKQNTLHFENLNGSDIYFYPAFIILVSEDMNVNLIEYSDLRVIFSFAEVLEPEVVYHDTEIIGKGWAKQNIDGTRDMRFSKNTELPRVRYGMLTFESDTGLNEVYIASSNKNAQSFQIAFEEFKSLSQNN